MVEFIKSCDQYPRKFNFGRIFSYIVLALYAEEKETLFGGNGEFPFAWRGDDKNLGESFAWGHE